MGTVISVDRDTSTKPKQLVEMNWDPITRIVGSLGIFTKIDFANRQVAECHSTSSIFRGYSIFMKGKDPRDAHFITSRICGICGDNHATCATYAQNMAFGIRPPDIAEWIVNLGEAAEYMFDHNIFQDNLVGVDFCEQMVKETNPAVFDKAEKTEASGAKLHGYKTIADIMRALNPFTGAFYQEALQMSRLTREMFCLMEGRHVHPSTLYPGGVGTVPTVQLFTDYLVRLMKYVEFMKKVVPLHDDLFNFFYEALPGYEKVGQRRVLLACWGSFNDPKHCDYTYKNMTEWGRKMFVTPGVVVDGKLVTTDLVDINLNIRILLGSSFYDGWQNQETFVKTDPLGNPVDQNHPWNQTTIPRPQKRDFNNKYTWVMSPRWYDKRTKDHLALDTGGSREYHNPADRRFHAQPVACINCGPEFYLREGQQEMARGQNAIVAAARLLQEGKIVAIKGLGGYHLACDALNADAVMAMRERKYRKEKPFAIMVQTVKDARSLVEISVKAEALLTSVARPIVLLPAKREIAGVAPENNELGVMLPYTPLHHLLFVARAPRVLVMTSANRSSEPIAYEDSDAIERLSGIADAFLVGERPIARRVDDSVVRVGAFGPAILRRARGYAPTAVATLPIASPILAIGADLKNTVTLVVEGQAFVSQHIGDLEHYQAHRAFVEVIEDLISMYDVRWDDLLIAHDAHPQYLSTTHALALSAHKKISVQHHRAHIASVLAERGAWEKPVLGVSFDGTGYGDDGTIWGGEIFAGSVKAGFQRVAHLRQAALPGGDAAARYPMQAAAGFLTELEDLPDLFSAPFHFDHRYASARQLVDKGVRSFATTSMGRLFDTAAALLGFTRETTFEGQAAIWLEQTARKDHAEDAYPFPLIGDELDFRPLFDAMIRDRIRGASQQKIARVFQRGIAHGLANALKQLAGQTGIETVVLSGGVFQNELLLEDLKILLAGTPLTIWTNHAVPANDGGISLGQAALAAFTQQENSHA